MLNFARWFPAGVTAFLAPTRPLVLQQAAAVAAAIGAAEGEVGVATGGTRAAGRADVWHSPAVRHVFTTPQAFHNDLRLGACPSDRVVCVIVDECHRAVGRADGAAALRRLAAGGVKARVVGLSATPGSTREAVQEVLTNLGAARIEFRAEDDADVAPYVSRRAERARVVPRPLGPAPARAAAAAALRRALAEAGPSYRGPSDPGCVPRATLLAAARDAEAAGEGGAAGWLRAAALLAGARDALDAYGLPAARDLLASHAATSAAAPLAAAGDPAWRALAAAAAAASAPGDAKLAALRDELAPLVAVPTTSSASTTRPRAIVFTTLRERVASVVDALRADGIDARAFVGQGAATAGGAGRGRGRGAAPPPPRRRHEAIRTDGRPGRLPGGRLPRAGGDSGGGGGAGRAVSGCCRWARTLRPPARGAAGGAHRARAAGQCRLVAGGGEGGGCAPAHGGGECEEKRGRGWLVGWGRVAPRRPLPPTPPFPQSTTALHAALRAQSFDLARRAPRMLPREFMPVRVDVPSPPRAAAAVPPPPPRPRGRARAAGATAVALPPSTALPAALAGLLFPGDTAQAVSVGDDGGLVIAPPPVGLGRDDAGSVDDVDEGGTDGDRARVLPSPPRPPLAPRPAPQSGASPVAKRLSQMTASGSVKQHTVRRASSVGDAGGSAPVAPPPAARPPR